jgi:hypothetical protein
MPGICTSVIRQAVSHSRCERRKSSADAKDVTAYPSERMRSVIARRNDSSSSTIEMTSGAGN